MAKQMLDLRIPSILKSVKKKCGMDPDFMGADFDADLIDAINLALNYLTQYGVGPKGGFIIRSDRETWSDFIGDDPMLEMARTYVFDKCRLIFDPPQNSFLVDAIKERIAETEWRLNVQIETPCNT